MIHLENVKVGYVPDEIKPRLGDLIESGELHSTYTRRYEVYADRSRQVARIELLWHTHDGFGNDWAGRTDLVIDYMDEHGNYL